MPESIVSNVALKEWAITCEALSEGRQIILLRKGGLLDEDGSFSLEHGQFFLLPTWLHQEEGLVKPDHRDLFRFTKNYRKKIFKPLSCVISREQKCCGRSMSVTRRS